MKIIVPRGMHLKFSIIRILMTQHFCKGDKISDDKLMNLCEIWLFQLDCGATKATRDNHRGIW